MRFDLDYTQLKNELRIESTVQSEVINLWLTILKTSFENTPKFKGKQNVQIRFKDDNFVMIINI